MADYDEDNEEQVDWYELASSAGGDERSVMSTFAELELLRARNLELHSELEKRKYTEKNVTYMRKIQGIRALNLF